MLKVEISVVIYVPGEEDNVADLTNAHLLEQEVEAALYEKYLRSGNVIINRVSTVNVEQDDEAYPQC